MELTKIIITFLFGTFIIIVGLISLKESKGSVVTDVTSIALMFFAFAFMFEVWLHPEKFERH